MSGHSKWSTIKHKKAAQDSKRGKVFSQVSRMIRVAVKEGKSGDPSQNPALRVALDKAKAVNMPKVNVQRAIDRGLGRSAAGQSFEEVLYEGYAAGGVGVLVLTITDNRNRTGSEVRHFFDKYGGSLGSPGSAAYLFKINQDGEYKVKVPLVIEDEGVRKGVLNLVSMLENHDDVEMVVHNLSG